MSLAWASRVCGWSPENATRSVLSLRDIGSRLYVSRNTTKSHVASVYRKLGVTSRTAAIARGRQLDLI